jgi:hypothetical protein
MAAAERSLVEVLNTVFGNVEDIVRSEINLARAEVREDIARTTYGLRWLALGALAAFFALGFALLALYFALLYSLPAWAAALLIAGGLGIISAVLLKVRSARVRTLNRWPASPFAAPSKENLPWVKPPNK